MNPQQLLLAFVSVACSVAFGLLLMTGLDHAGQLAVSIARKLEPPPSHSDQFDWMEQKARVAAACIALAGTVSLAGILLIIGLSA